MSEKSKDSIGKAQFEFPLKISVNKRYLVDQKNKPFLYHADTGWLIFSDLTEEEAEEYLADRLEKRFNTIQAMLLPMETYMVNRNGASPFIDGDVSKPNEEYFRHVDKIISMAAEKGLALVIGPAFITCWEDYEFVWSKALERNGPEKCLEYGRFLGKRYGSLHNVMWFIGGDRDPLDLRESLIQLALGIKESAPHQLMTYHSTTTHSSTDEFPEEGWLDFSMTYTYFRGKLGAAVAPENFLEVYEVNHKEYRKDLKPFVLGEAMYEGCDGITDSGSPYRMRKQAYWSLLTGSCGHAYGSRVYSFKPGWKESLQLTGAHHMRHFFDLLSAREWYRLVPDFGHNVLLDGYGTWSCSNYVTAACTEDGGLMIAYVPLAPASLVVDMKKLQPQLKAYWYDPTTGSYLKASGQSTKAQGVLQFTTPFDQNAVGDPDWILIMTEG